MTRPDGTVSGKPIVIVLAVVLLTAAVYKWWPSDERAIRRQLDALADTLTMPSTDIESARAVRLAELGSYFAPDAHIRFAGQDLPSRSALLAFAERWTPPRGLFVEFTDVGITVGSDGTAEIALVVKSTSGPASTVDTRGAVVRMAASQGDWVVTSVEESPIRSGELREAPAPR